MLRVRDLHFTYPGWPPTLAGVDLDVASGQCVFLVGPSGAGKSTLLRCIAGLARPQTGAITWDGKDITRQAAHQRRFAMMAQEPALFPHLDVAGNVAFGMRYAGVPRSQRRSEVARWLDFVGLATRGGDDVAQLSGGQRQRVELARTLAVRPRLVLLDEPMSGLDHALRRELGDKVRAGLRQAGAAALWVTHDEAEAARLGDLVLRLRDGRLVPA